MNKRSLAYIVITIIGLVFTGTSQVNSGATHVNIDLDKLAKISEILVTYEKLGRFNGAITIKKGNEVIYERTNGYANRITKVKNGSDKIFPIASLSKQFTASGILLLAEQGKLSLNDPISTYLPSYQNEVGKKTTIYHLLTHTAGIPDPMDMGNGIDDENDSVMKEKTLPIEQQRLINTFKDLPSKFLPGSRHDYTNTGYILLADIIERASGQTYASFLQKNIFAPAGMTQTSANRPDGNPLLVESYSGIGADRLHNTKLHNSWVVGAAGLYSTSQDLFKWVEAMNAHKIIKDAEFGALLAKPVSLGRNDEFYGYGMEMKKLWDQKVYRHDGATVGTVSDFLYFPEQDITMVVYMNHVHNVHDIGYSIENRKQLIKQVSGVLFGHDMLVPLALNNNKPALEQYVGHYFFDSQHHVEIILKNQTLQLKTTGKKNWSLYKLAQLTHLPTDQLTEKSTRFFNILNSKKLEGLTVLFDEKMASAPLSMFSGFWQELESQFGALEENYSFSKSSDDGQIQQRLVFEGAIVDMAIFFNGEGKIEGIQNSAPVSKEEGEAFSTNLLSQKNDQLLVDGYVLKQGEDLFLKFTRNEKNQISGFSYNQKGNHVAVKH
jgi:CubicO group peptidase (beta-lactamase class C family)